ncbi:MAG: hypothetical protein KU38_11600 [Sulfurovum sp. FS08-3]|nr:MAG: hypothetical protein KU38_11600 [Sulfurovum sp. FS08-3]
MQTIDFDTIPLQEKFMLMEQLWESLSHEANANGFTPKWHLNELDKRQKKIERGQSSFSDFGDAKKRLYKFDCIEQKHP